MVVHQFDNYEANGHLWKGPTAQSHRGEIIGYVCGMVMFQAMHERRDRRAVPMIFEHGGGVVINPSTKLRCLYGDDGATYKAPGGCWQPFCDASNPRSPNSGGGDACGFGGNDQVRNAWKPRDLKTVLELYGQHSQPYKSPSFFSGYNELVFDADDYNARMPQTIEAFFLIRNGKHYSTSGLAATAHYDFVSTFGAKVVPLLAFDAANWAHPFSASLPEPSDASECASWCNRWTSSESACQDCVG